MNKTERFLIWHYKHHRALSIIWTALGWVSLPAVVVVGKDSRCFFMLFLLWYTIFSIAPSGLASELLLAYTEQKGLVEPTI